MKSLKKKIWIIVPALILIVLGVICAFIIIKKPTPNLNEITGAFPEQIEKIPLTEAEGIDDKKAISLISEMIQYDHNVFTNIYLCGHLPYDTDSIENIDGIRCAKVTTDYFKTVGDIERYLFLLNGTVFGRDEFCDEFNAFYYSHYVQALYRDTENGLYVNVDEIHLGRTPEKWSSFSFKVDKTTSSDDGFDNYSVTVKAVLDDGKTKEYPYEIFRQDGRYMCTTSVLPDIKYISVEFPSNQQFTDLVWKNDVLSAHQILSSVGSRLLDPNRKTYVNEENCYLLNPEPVFTYKNVKEYLSGLFSAGYSDKVLEAYFYKKDGKLYLRNPYKNDEPVNNYIFRHSNPQYTYESDTRREFVITSSAVGTDISYERYFITVKEGDSWKLLRLFSCEGDDLLIANK